MEAIPQFILYDLEYLRRQDVFHALRRKETPVGSISCIVARTAPDSTTQDRGRRANVAGYGRADGAVEPEARRALAGPYGKTSPVPTTHQAGSLQGPTNVG